MKKEFKAMKSSLINSAKHLAVLALLLLFANTALAASIQIRTGSQANEGVYNNDTTTPLAVGCSVEIISAGTNGVIDAPNSDGSLGGDDKMLGTGSVGQGYLISPNGRFTFNASVNPNQIIYVRAWNNTTEATGTYYGQSGLITVPATVADGDFYNLGPGGGWNIATATNAHAFDTTNIKPAPSPGTLQFSSAAYSVAENGTTATITITRTGGNSGAVSVNYATSNGTATSGSDYTATGGTLSWANGDSANKTFTVAILNDSAVEGSETVTLTLSSPTGGATLGTPNTAVLTITDDDGGTDSIKVTSPNGGETWISGTTPTITWTPTGSIANVKIDMSIDSGATWTVLAASTANDGSWTFPTPISTTGTYPNCRVRISDAVDGNPSDISDADFTVTVGGTSPDITNITPTSAEVGRTITITGSNFGSRPSSTSLVRFGTTVAYPTSWSDSTIVVAVPTGVPAGEIDVFVVTAAGSDSEPFTVLGSDDSGITSIYIDDFEGGCVGDWTLDNDGNGKPDSGYYAFGSGITPSNESISADLRKSDAAYAGNFGAKINYSYTSGWGGGWGGKLANVLDLSAIDAIKMFVKWDSSGNDVKFSLKDGDGTVFSATVSNATLTRLSGYGQVTILKPRFSFDATSTPTTGADSDLNWSQITDYSLVYTTTGTSADYQNIDNIIACSGGITNEVTITAVNPAAGPAGTTVTVTGGDFGAAQGLSSLIFENSDTGVTYTADVLSWSSASIQARVPELAVAGNYTIKVIKVAITAGATRAQESNPAGFKVTSSGPAEGKAFIFPNPFNPLAEKTGQPNAAAMKAATIAFNPGSSTRIGVYIFDMTARLVKKIETSGSQVNWDGMDEYSTLVGDGAYILRVIDEDSKQVIASGKILVIKK